MCSASIPGILANIVPDSVSDSVVAVLFVAFTGILTQIPVNSQAIAENKLHPIGVRVAVVLLYIMSLLSLTGVTHFIYAYF